MFIPAFDDYILVVANDFLDAFEVVGLYIFLFTDNEAISILIEVKYYQTTTSVVREKKNRVYFVSAKIGIIFNTTKFFSRTIHLYIESPAYVHDLLQSELRHGRLVP